MDSSTNVLMQIKQEVPVLIGSAWKISLPPTMYDEHINLIFWIRGVIIAELYVNRIRGAI